MQCTASNSPGGRCCLKCYKNLPDDCPQVCTIWAEIASKKSSNCFNCVKVTEELVPCHNCDRDCCLDCLLPESWQCWLGAGLEGILCTVCTPAELLVPPPDANNWCPVCQQEHSDLETPQCLNVDRDSTPLFDLVSKGTIEPPLPESQGFEAALPASSRSNVSVAAKDANPTPNSTTKRRQVSCKPSLTEVAVSLSEVLADGEAAGQRLSSASVGQVIDLVLEKMNQGQVPSNASKSVGKGCEIFRDDKFSNVGAKSIFKSSSLPPALASEVNEKICAAVLPLSHALADIKVTLGDIASQQNKPSIKRSHPGQLTQTADTNIQTETEPALVEKSGEYWQDYQDTKPVTNGSLRESLEKFEKRIEQKTNNSIAQGLVIGIQALSMRENQRTPVELLPNASPLAIEGSKRQKAAPRGAVDEPDSLLECIQKLADRGPEDLTEMGAKMFQRPKNTRNKAYRPRYKY